MHIPSGTTGTIIEATTLKKFKQAMRTGKRGDRIIYHTGFLLWDRTAYNKKISEAQREELKKVANEAWKALSKREVILLQRRVADGCEYVAVKR